MNSTGLPLVLQGFLHSDQCLSYWHFDQRDRGKLKEFEKHPSLDLISCHIGLEMYILEGDFSLERVKELNLEIRTSRFHKLEYTLYHSCPRIDTIKEFSLDLRIGESIPIPITFPGIGLMLTSIDGALEAQGQPSKNVKRALLSAREGKTTNA